MGVKLIGEVATTADVEGDFTGLNGGANISTDDDFVQGTGAIGDKMSSSTELLASDNLTSTYDFSSSGGEFGYHIIMWFNTKTPVAATGGLRVYVGDSAANDSGVWYVDPLGFYDPEVLSGRLPGSPGLPRQLQTLLSPLLELLRCEEVADALRQLLEQG